MAGCDSDSGDRSQGQMALVQQIQPALPPELEQTAPGAAPGGPASGGDCAAGWLGPGGTSARAGRRMARTLKTRLFVGLTYKAEMGL